MEWGKSLKICQGIAQTINEAMIVRNKTLSALAEEIGVPISSLQNYASGRSNPRADTIEILAEKLGVSPAELISSHPEEWRKAETVLRAANEFSALTPEQKEVGIRLFLSLVQLFSRGNQS